jgi:F0F1-type ATP synthase delta subunit
MSNPLPNDDKWLPKFFSGRNQIHWEGIRNNTAFDGWGRDVLSWIDILDSGHSDAPLCLPCVSEDGVVQWYIGSRTSQGANALVEELRAFVGQSYVNFDGRPHVLDTSDPVESALQRIFIPPLYKIELLTTTERKSVRRAFALYQDVVSRRPPISRPATRPFSIVRGLFDRALLAGNEKEARSLLEEMKRSGRLTSENILFLGVRISAGLGLWLQIVLEATVLHDLNDFPLPPRVVRDVAEAFYRVYVEPQEDEKNLDQLLQVLKEARITRLSSLFATRHGIKHPTVIKMFLLNELLQEKTNVRHAQNLMSLLQEKQKTPLFEQIRERLELAVPDHSDEVDAQAEADEAFEDNEYDKALLLYLELPISIGILKRMVTCAKSNGDAQSAKSVITFYDKLEPQEAKKLNSATIKALDTLKEQSQPIPSPEIHEKVSVEDKSTELNGWLAWARWVAGGATFKDSEYVLQNHVEAWTVENLLDDHKASEEFSDLIGNAGKEQEEIFRSAFPVLFQTFVGEIDSPQVALKGLYTNILLILSTSDSVSKDDLTMSAQLAGAILELGVSNDDYKDLLENMTLLLNLGWAFNTFEWALDVAENLAVEHAPNAEARLRFFTEFLSLAVPLSHRMTASHRRMLDVLCRDFDVPLPEKFHLRIEDENEEDEGIKRHLSGKTIGIYTLTEQAGRRAVERIKEIAPDCVITLNSDHVCTDSLKSLAKSVDIFIFVWRSSKHQAFYCIKNNRSPDLPFLQPPGKGSASIIREIQNSQIN